MLELVEQGDREGRIEESMQVEEIKEGIRKMRMESRARSKHGGMVDEE